MSRAFLGMNACLRAVVRMALFVGCKIYYIKEGYQGMIEGDVEEATWGSVSSIIHKVCIRYKSPVEAIRRVPMSYKCAGWYSHRLS